MALDTPGASELQKLEMPERFLGDIHTPGGLSREAYSLLALANLLRMRGAWQEATEKCMEALRLSPENSSAQSLLGDIYENQGRLDDAIQWYRMALDMQPDSPADQAKLAQLLERKALAVRANAAVSQEHSRPPDALPPAEAPQTWLGRLRSDPDLLLRRSTFVAGSLALLVVLAALVWVHNTTPLEQLGAGRPVHAPNVVVPGTQPAPPNTPTAPVEPLVPAGDPADISLLTAVKASPTLAQQGITAESVQTDPRSGLQTLTIACQASPASPLSRDAIMAASVVALQALSEQTASDSAGQFTIRCLLASPSGGSTPLVFTADTSRAAIAALGANLASVTAAQVAAIFSNPWWSPNIPQSE